MYYYMYFNMYFPLYFYLNRPQNEDLKKLRDGQQTQGNDQNHFEGAR
jgi:hypothetical protein